MVEARKAAVGIAIAWLALAAVPGVAVAGDGDAVHAWVAKVWAKICNPWFIFGMIAQVVFFGRFVVQWYVSEKRKRSTVPIVFWYLSLLGGVLMLIYAIKIADPVILFGQLLACVIYLRNLMLIFGRKGRIQDRRRERALQEEMLESNGEVTD